MAQRTVQPDGDILMPPSQPRRRLAAGKRRIEKRLDNANCLGCEWPMLRPAIIQYALVERTRGMTYGGIGSLLLFARKLGLAEAID